MLVIFPCFHHLFLPILHLPSTGNTVLPGPFYLNNMLVAPYIIKNLTFVPQFTTDNHCSVEFDPFGLSVKGLRSRNVIIRCSGPLYTMPPPAPSSASLAPRTSWT
jgi:hypothetical protein